MRVWLDYIPKSSFFYSFIDLFNSYFIIINTCITIIIIIILVIIVV
jgi:hypothetical protein